MIIKKDSTTFQIVNETGTVISVDCKIVQNMDLAIQVMYKAAKWLETSGKNPDMYWKPQNMNKDYLLKHAEPQEFYVVTVNNVPAASAILQDNERNQSWKSVDRDNPQKALYIHWLAVHRDFAGKGLPQKIIAFAKEKANQIGAQYLRLDTNADEQKLMKIYEDLGFNLVCIDKEKHHNTAFFQIKI